MPALSLEDKYQGHPPGKINVSVHVCREFPSRGHTRRPPLLDESHEPRGTPPNRLPSKIAPRSTAGRPGPPGGPHGGQLRGRGCSELRDKRAHTWGTHKDTTGALAASELSCARGRGSSMRQALGSSAAVEPTKKTNGRSSAGWRVNQPFITDISIDFLAKSGSRSGGHFKTGMSTTGT